MLSQKIDRLLEFLPQRIERPFAKGKFDARHGSYSSTKEIRAFREACMEVSWHFAFDWVNEIEEIKKWNIEEASLSQLGKLLYAIIRQDRFVENNFYCFATSDESLFFLKRLQFVATPEAIAEIETQQ